MRFREQPRAVKHGIIVAEHHNCLAARKEDTMLQPNKQTAIYCRTALYDNEGFAIETQKLRLFDFAQKHRFTNLVCYVDNGFSGLSLNRPSFLTMQNAIIEGKVSTVLVVDISRIGRSYIEVTKWLNGMRKMGATIIDISFFSSDGVYSCSPYTMAKGGVQQ